MLLLSSTSQPQCIQIGTVQNDDDDRISERFTVTISGTNIVTVIKGQIMVTILEASLPSTVAPSTVAPSTVAPSTVAPSTVAPMLNLPIMVSSPAINVSEGEAAKVCIYAEFPPASAPEDVITVKLAGQDISTCEC